MLLKENHRRRRRLSATVLSYSHRPPSHTMALTLQQRLFLLTQKRVAMPMVADPTQPQRRRRTETVPENVTFEREAHDILMHYRPPGWHGTRIFIEWLIDDHDTRAQGREPLPSLPHIARGGMPTIAASTRTQRSRRPDVIELVASFKSRKSASD